MIALINSQSSSSKDYDLHTVRLRLKFIDNMRAITGAHNLYKKTPILFPKTDMKVKYHIYCLLNWIYNGKYIHNNYRFGHLSDFSSESATDCFK